jgi:peptidoglycan/xylan/chitin deacetylase (PgdA/CDA1 family)
MTRKIPILLYHRVGGHDGSFMDKYTVSPKTFAEQMEAIKRYGWRPITLENALSARVDNNTKRSLVLTFDDGFASNREHAWPVLERYGFPSDTFVVTDCLGSYNSWDGPSRASYPLLSANDLAAADPRLMTFHSHTATHQDLTFLRHDLKSLRRELEDSRCCLAELSTGGNFFAYPSGSWNWQVMEHVRDAGYAGACTCMEGLNSARTNPFLLRRVEMRECDMGLRLWLKICMGREIVQWPPQRPAEVSILAAWLRRDRKLDRIIRAADDSPNSSFGRSR